MTRIAASVATTALTLAAALTSAPAAGAATTTTGDLVRLTAVAPGAIDRVPGNRHRLQLAESPDGQRGRLRSWYCPRGAMVTPTWTSGRCTPRLDLSVTFDPAGTRVGSNGHIAVVDTTVTVGAWARVPLDLEVRLVASGDRQIIITDGRDQSVEVRDAAAWGYGRLEGRPLDVGGGTRIGRWTATSI